MNWGIWYRVLWIIVRILIFFYGGKGSYWKIVNIGVI